MYYYREMSTGEALLIFGWVLAPLAGLLLGLVLFVGLLYVVAICLGLVVQGARSLGRYHASRVK